MFIYRLDRSVERRVFKINVGAIDEADVPAYVQEIANNFKRTPIIDPMTGQIDLRKNIMPVWKKTPIPLLDGRTITIEDLAKEYSDDSSASDGGNLGYFNRGDMVSAFEEAAIKLKVNEYKGQSYKIENDLNYLMKYININI